MAPYIETIRRYSNARIVLRAHNVEHEYYEHLNKAEKDVKKKIYLRNEVSKLEKFESILHKAKAVLAISQKDYEQNGFYVNIVSSFFELFDYK